MNMAIILVIWFENHEFLYMTRHFVKGVLKRLWNFKLNKFHGLVHKKWLHACQRILFLWFSHLFWLFSQWGQAGMVILRGWIFQIYLWPVKSARLRVQIQKGRNLEYRLKMHQLILSFSKIGPQRPVLLPFFGLWPLFRQLHRMLVGCLIMIFGNFS